MAIYYPFVMKDKLVGLLGSIVLNTYQINICVFLFWNEIIPLSDDPIPLYLSVVLGRGSSVIGTPMHLYLLDIVHCSIYFVAI